MQKHLKTCKRKPVIVGIEPGVYIMALLLGIPGGGYSEEMQNFMRDFVPENGELAQKAVKEFLTALYDTGLVLEPRVYFKKIDSLRKEGKSGIDLQKEL